MRLLRWFASVSALASIGIAVGWLWADAKTVSDVATGSPEATMTSSIASAQAQPATPLVALPAGDRHQAQPTSPPAVPEPPPVAAQSAVPTPAPKSLPTPAPPAPLEGAQPHTTTLYVGVVPETAGAPAQKASAPSTTSTEQRQAAQADTLAVLPRVPSYGLQTRVDERRDELRRQSDARLDAYRGLHPRMPPWFAAYDDTLERYRDARRYQFRRQRDLGRQRHANWMDAICPWSKPQRDWSAKRSYDRQMEQLDRRAYRDAFVYRPPQDFARPMRW